MGTGGLFLDIHSAVMPDMVKTTIASAFLSDAKSLAERVMQTASSLSGVLRMVSR